MVNHSAISKFQYAYTRNAFSAFDDVLEAAQDEVLAATEGWLKDNRWLINYQLYNQHRLQNILQIIESLPKVISILQTIRQRNKYQNYVLCINITTENNDRLAAYA